MLHRSVLIALLLALVELPSASCAPAAPTAAATPKAAVTPPSTTAPTAPVGSAAAAEPTASASPAAAQAPPPNAPRAFVIGTVTKDGKALEGARVVLYLAYAPGTGMLVDGFPMRSFNKPHDESITTANGRFSVSTPHRAKFFVRVSYSGYPDTELGPLDLDPAVAPVDHTIELTKGARIEGRVLVPEGYAKQGLVVVASRADFFPAATTTDKEGRFVFEKLTPGRYLVKYTDRPIDERTSLLEATRITVPELPTNCVVAEGGTAQVEIDARNRPQIAGRIAFDKVPASGWTVSMRSRGISQPVRSATTDAAGTFRLEGEVNGEYAISLAGKLAGGITFKIEDVVKLQQRETAWEHAFSSGRVKGRSLNPNYKLLHLTWQTDSALVGHIYVKPDAAGEFSVPALPAGNYKIANSRLGEDTDLELFVVKAGEETILSLP